MRYSIFSIFILLTFVRFSSVAEENKKTFVRFKQYDFKLYNKVICQKDFDIRNGKNEYIFGNSKWSLTIDTIRNADESLNFTYNFKCIEGSSDETSVSVVYHFDEWDNSNYVLIPSALYNGNKFDWRRIRYSPKLLDPRDIGKDIAPIVTDVPKLNKEEGPSFVQLRSGAASTPSISFFDSINQSGFILLTEQGNSNGDYGLEVEELRGKKQATIAVTTPLVRERYKYKITDNLFPSDDIAKNFNKGDKFSIQLEEHCFKAKNVQDLYSKFAKVRKNLTTKNVKYNLVFPWSNLFQVQQKKFNSENYVKEHGYYSVGMRESFLQDWQIGWTGGMITTYPLLFSGDENTRENVIGNFNWLFPNGIGKSGFFYGFCENGTNWFGGDKRKFHTKNWHLTRKSADAIFFIITQFDLMKKAGFSVDPKWESGIVGVCDAFVKLWNENKQIGQFVDINTGEIIVGGSTSAGILPAGLILASNYFNNEKYFQVAKEIGAYYYSNYTQKGLSCGGPGDAMQNPDSESSYALMESYFALYESTKDKNWLKAAEEAAMQFSTWVISYNYNFPIESTYGKFNIKSLGGVFANTQNTHGAPGICTHSGMALLKLFRATGNVFYADLLSDITHALPQCFSHPERPLPDAHPGWVNERISTTDWNEGIGEMMQGSTWAETAMLLTYTQIPGVYICADNSEVICFDNIETEIIEENKKSIKVKITNPTAFDANVRIWEEDIAGKKRALGANYLFNCREILIKAKDEINISFKR